MNRRCCLQVRGHTTGKVMLTLNKRRRCRHLIPHFISALFLFTSLLSSTALTVTSPEAAARRPQQQQQKGRNDRRHRWSTTTTTAPKRRQPVPLDCSEGLQLCREDLTCRTLLDTLDGVCDRSSTSLCRTLFSISPIAAS